MTRPRDDLYWLRFPEKSTESPQCPFAYRGFTLIYGFFHPDGIIENPTIKFYYPFMPRIFCIFNGLSIYTLVRMEFPTGIILALWRFWFLRTLTILLGNQVRDKVQGLHLEPLKFWFRKTGGNKAIVLENNGTPWAPQIYDMREGWRPLTLKF